jgi:hypothetical protein
LLRSDTITYGRGCIACELTSLMVATVRPRTLFRSLHPRRSPQCRLFRLCHTAHRNCQKSTFRSDPKPLAPFQNRKDLLGYQVLPLWGGLAGIWRRRSSLLRRLPFQESDLPPLWSVRRQGCWDPGHLRKCRGSTRTTRRSRLRVAASTLCQLLGCRRPRSFRKRLPCRESGRH